MLHEVDDHALIARDLGYLPPDDHQHTKELIDTIDLDLNKIIKTLMN